MKLIVILLVFAVIVVEIFSCAECKCKEWCMYETRNTKLGGK